MKKIMKMLLAVSLSTAVSLSGCSNEKSDATAEFNEAKTSLEQANTEADAAIASLQALIDSDNEPLSNKTIKAADNAISQLQEDKVETVELPEDVDSIKPKTIEMKAVDYSADLAAIEKAKDALEDSIAKCKLVTKPKESQVIKRLKKVKHVTAVKAVTEDNDPNGQLGKQGGYTATVYFTCDWVNQSEVDGNDVVAKGTEGGGAVEVYANVKNAQKRSDYLGTLDGGIFASGSHYIYGTCVVRTSDKLTASQQKRLTKSVVEALTKLD